MTKKNGFFMNITHRSMAKGINVLRNAGYAKPRNAEEMYNMLEDYVKSDPKKAIISLSKIHPDSEIIIKSYEEWKQLKPTVDKKQSIEEGVNKFSNCSGCVKSENINAAGDTPEKNKISSTTLIVSGAVVIVISLIAAIAISKSK